MSRIACKSAWGKFTNKGITTGNETSNETVWNLVHDQLTYTKPEHPSMLANLPEGENEDNIVTYQHYIDTLHPLEKRADGTFDPAVE